MEIKNVSIRDYRALNFENTIPIPKSSEALKYDKVHIEYIIISPTVNDSVILYRFSNLDEIFEAKRFPSPKISIKIQRKFFPKSFPKNLK